MKNRRFAWLCGVAAIAYGSIAISQTSVTPPQGSTQSADSAAADVSQLQEIVVTAQKRQENLQLVPIAVSAFSGSDLIKAGTANVLDLAEITAGLNVQVEGPDTEVFIRGVGTSTQTVGDEPNVAMYVDGIYRPIVQGSLFEFADVDRVEVLKGPQGTLFGRNATGGLINVVTKTPSLTQSTGDFSLSWGRFDTPEFKGFVSGPLSSNVAAGLSTYYTRSDGYITDPNYPGRDVDRLEIYGGRGKILWQVADDSRIIFTVDATHSSDPSPNLPTTVNNSSALAPLLPLVSPHSIIPGQPFTSAGANAGLGFAESVQNEAGAAIDASVGFGSFNLISLTGYRNSQYFGDPDGDQTPLDTAALVYSQHLYNASEDIRLESSDPAAKLKWTAGAFGYYSSDRWSPYSVFVGGFPFLAPPTTLLFQNDLLVRSTSFAAYGQGSYQFDDHWMASLGLRYSYDHKNQDLTSTSIAPEAAKADFHNVSPKAILQYAFSPATMVYASYGEGYKSGTFNAFQYTDPNPADANKVVQPEIIHAYELGLKSDLTKNFRANLSVFYDKYSDLQQDIQGGQEISNILENAASAKIKGADADLFAAFADVLSSADKLSLKVSISYLDAHFDAYPNATTWVYPGPEQGLLTGSVNASGDVMPRAPKWTESLTIDYSKPLPIGTVGVDANVYFNSGFFYDSADTPLFAQPSYHQINAALNWASSDSHFSASVWGRNLTNALTFQVPYTSALFEALRYYPPRTYGIRFGYHF